MKTLFDMVLKREPRYDFYFAAPLFSKAEKEYNTDMAGILRRGGFQVYLPQEYLLSSVPEAIFENNLEQLLHSKNLIAICEGTDVDSGTSWEMGQFYGRGQIFALRTDFRMSGDDQETGLNLMLSQSTIKIFTDDLGMCMWLAKNVEPLDV